MNFQSKNQLVALCTTYDAHDPVLLDGVMPYVSYLEVTPDSIAQSTSTQKTIHPDILDDLKRVSKTHQIIAHGVGLSIGSYEGYSESYLDLLDKLLDADIDLAWHSEHLGYTHVGGENLNTMLTIPRTNEALKMLIPRIKTLQKRYQIPFLLENVAEFIPNYQPDYSDAEFLNQIAKETDCGLILDIYNLECDAINFGFNISDFLQNLELSAVQEIHIAGGVMHDGFQLDIHSRTVAESTIEWTKEVLSRENQIKVITYEILPQAIQTFGQQMVIEEVARLSEIFQIKK